MRSLEKSKTARTQKRLIAQQVWISQAAKPTLADMQAQVTEIKRTPHGRLMLTVLGGLAEFERSLILQRTTAGRELARQRGIKFGRPSKLSDYQRHEALARIANGERQADIARSYQVSPALICVLAKE